MNIYIDSSAYVKEYHDETGSDKVHRIFENSRKGVLMYRHPRLNRCPEHQVLK